MENQCVNIQLSPWSSVFSHFAIVGGCDVPFSDSITVISIRVWSVSNSLLKIEVKKEVKKNTKKTTKLNLSSWGKKDTTGSEEKKSGWSRCAMCDQRASLLSWVRWCQGTPADQMYLFIIYVFYYSFSVLFFLKHWKKNSYFSLFVYLYVLYFLFILLTYIYIYFLVEFSLWLSLENYNKNCFMFI